MNRLSLSLLSLLTFVVLLFSISSSTLAMAEDPPIVLPQGTLDAPQLEQLFSGNTFAATVEGKDQMTVIFFGKDGHLTRVRDGWQTDGVWEVRKDGRICVDLKGSRRDCRIIVNQDKKYRQYAVKKDGNHRYEMTYTDSRPGNQLAKISKEPLLPRGTLKRKQVIKLFSGQEVESVTASKGRVSISYYNPDGSLEQLRDGMTRLGKWKVNKSSRICLQMEGLEEKCRIIVKEGDEYKKYIVKKNGRHQHSVSYRNFTPGKSFK